MTQSISDALQADHERLDGVFATLTDQIRERRPDAMETLEKLRTGLDNHIRFEEEVLFRAVRGATRAYPLRGIESLTIDHERIREMLAALRATVDRGDFAGAESAADELKVHLDGHNRDEEIGIYRDADRLLSEAEHARLLTIFSGGSS
ncbi:MAG: hemerythrin domain-containing protein [Planctomycetes bacterium]|nr:hemerythrin domain-containing protein [Planctomycetota bacterium]